MSDSEVGKSGKSLSGRALLALFVGMSVLLLLPVLFSDMEPWPRAGFVIAALLFTSGFVRLASKRGPERRQQEQTPPE